MRMLCLLKSVALLLLFAGISRAQIVVTPPVPPSGGTGGKIDITGGMIVCHIQGDIPPTQGVQVSCSVGANSITPYYVKIPLNSNHTVSYVLDPGNPPTKNPDMVTCLIAAQGTAGVLKFDCAALTNGMESHASGTL